MAARSGHRLARPRGSAGALAVIEGTLDEATPVSPTGWQTHQTVERRLPAGTVRSFGQRHVHDVVNSAAAPAISLHVYSPALSTMSRYRLVDGRLVTTSVERAGRDW